MSFEVPFPFENLPALVTLKRLDVTDAVNSRLVQLYFTLCHKLPAADIARVLGVRMLWSWRRRRSSVARSVRRVVMSADR